MAVGEIGGTRQNFMDQGTRGSIAVDIVNPRQTYGVIWSFELTELTLLRSSPGIEANVEHPDTLRFTFTVSPSYVKSS